MPNYEETLRAMEAVANRNPGRRNPECIYVERGKREPVCLVAHVLVELKAFYPDVLWGTGSVEDAYPYFEDTLGFTGDAASLLSRAQSWADGPDNGRDTWENAVSHAKAGYYPF